MYAFNAVTKKPDQVLMPHMTDSINLDSKLFLSLSPKKSINQSKLNKQKVKDIQILVIRLLTTGLESF